MAQVILQSTPADATRSDMTPSYRTKLLEQLARVRLCGLKRGVVCLQCDRTWGRGRTWLPAICRLNNDVYVCTNGVYVEKECALHGHRYPVCSRCYSCHSIETEDLTDYVVVNYPSLC